MSALEIALLIFGLILIVVSFFLVDKTGEAPANTVPVPDMKQLNVISERAIRDMNTNANKLLETTQDQLEEISNDKIMAVNEYSDQVLAKIDTNHKETVFLYQMLQDKEKELKETVGRIESLRIALEKQDFAEAGSIASKITENAPVSDAPRKLDIGMEDFSFDDADDEPYEEDPSVKNMKSKDRAKQRITNVPGDVKKELKKNAPEKNEKTNEVINLYKKNKSVLEISKLLNMGQGEVKLIIELYCK